MTARRRSKRKSSKKKSSRKKRAGLALFVKKLFSFFKIFLILLTVFVAGLAITWWLLPNIVSIQHSQDLVLYSTQPQTGQGSELEKIYYVIFDTELNKVSLQSVDLHSQADFFYEKKQQQKNLTDWWQLAQPESRAEVDYFFSWLLQQPAKQIEFLSDQADLTQKKFIIYLKKQIFAPYQSLKNRFAWLRLYCFAKNNDIQLEPLVELTALKLWQDNQADNQCATAVLNTTKISGLASQVAQLAENAGLKVVRIDNPATESDEFGQRTVVLLNEARPECVAQQTVLAKFLGEQIKLQTRAESDDYWFERYRADMVILLGEDQDLVTKRD